MREDDSPEYEGTLIWEFDIFSAPAAAVITIDEERFETLPPVDLQTPRQCNCFCNNRHLCMVDFDQPHQDQVEVNDPLEELLDGRL